MIKRWWWLAFVAGCASGAAARRGELPKLSKVVYGLVGSFDSEPFITPTPLLDTYVAWGGVTFDPTARHAFIASQNGLVRAVSDPELEEVWRYKHGQPLTMPPRYLQAKKEVNALDQDVVVVGSMGGELVALDAHSGSLAWQYEVGGELRSLPILHQQRLLVGNSRNQLAAIDPSSGKWLWQYSRDFPQSMTVMGHAGASADGNYAYVGFADGFVASVRIEDGTAAWARPLTLSSTGFADADATPEVMGNRVFAASFEDGIYALSKETGDTLWQLAMRGVTHITAKDPRIYATSANGEVIALDAETGRTLWRFKFPVATVTKPIAYRGYVAFGLSPGGLYVVEEDTGRPVQYFNPGGITSELSLTAGELGFLSDNAVAYIMRYGERSALTFDHRRRFLGL